MPFALLRMKRRPLIPKRLCGGCAVLRLARLFRCF